MNGGKTTVQAHGSRPLLERNSAVRLSEPAPQGGDRDTVLQAAIALLLITQRLRPWRFLRDTKALRPGPAFGNLMAEVGALDLSGGLFRSRCRNVYAASAVATAPLLYRTLTCPGSSQHP